MEILIFLFISGKLRKFGHIEILVIGIDVKLNYITAKFLDGKKITIQTILKSFLLESMIHYIDKFSLDDRLRF